jgi:citrate lyase subunit beta/citryl-CoA lyase
MENPFRSLLFVPGDQPGKIEKAWGAGSDCIVLDLEDGVAPSRKTIARQTIRETLPTAPSKHPAILVRIECDPPQRILDVGAAIHPGVFGIMLPKSSARHEILAVAKEMEQAERRSGVVDGSTRLFLLIESARGLFELPSLVAGLDRLAGIVFGAEDWCLDMGITRTDGGDEIEIARWNVVICARAHRLLAIDTPYANFHDVEGLRRDTETARRMGFTGKLAIHPEQIATIHSAFAPTSAEIEEARAVVAAFSEAELRGCGVVAVNGRMVDKPVAERFRQVLLRAGTANDHL